MITIAKFYFLIFGILTIAGGAMGAAKGSTISLVAGGIAGALLLVAFYLMGTQPTPGLITGLVVSLALAGRFAPIFAKKGGAFMPAGLMTILSCIGLILAVFALVKK